MISTHIVHMQCGFSVHVICLSRISGFHQGRGHCVSCLFLLFISVCCMLSMLSMLLFQASAVVGLNEQELLVLDAYYVIKTNQRGDFMKRVLNSQNVGDIDYDDTTGSVAMQQLCSM